MRLRHFKIKNFKSIQSLTVDWEELIVLIGENNCGKSSALLALSCYLSGSAIRDSRLFHKHQTNHDNAIELIGYFDQLNDVEINQNAIRGRLYEDQWILKKTYWYEVHPDNDEEAGEWKELLSTFSSRQVYVNWPTPDTTWGAFPAEYQPLIQQIEFRPARPNNESREVLKQLVRAQRPEIIQNSDPEWIPNPGGGGNWKSNANSIIPRAIFIRAVHEATDETNSKDASTFGKIINLIVERKLILRPEVIQLQEAFNAVLELFRPDNENPERQAIEIKELQNKINQGLKDVIGGEALIKTEPPAIQALILPTTSLVIHDSQVDIDTEVIHQGHGLQRTLIMTLLQLLMETQDEPLGADDIPNIRSTILIIEEPELYMHPQMEKRMRDVIYRLSSQQNMQLACCTHSPVFLDIADKYKAIIRLVKKESGQIDGYQVTLDLFPGADDQAEKERLQTVARFNSTVNELFFANQVVLFEESSSIAAFERAAELTGLYNRHPAVRRGVTLIDCAGKGNIPSFQKILNAFSINYRVVHDEDRNNVGELGKNVRIMALVGGGDPPSAVHLISPENLETLLGYAAHKSGSKPYMAVKKVEELISGLGLPREFIQAMNFIYFGTLTEP